MNYLAHAFLSAHNKELLVGNFIADHIKGQQFQTYSQGIIEGILMHRQIDTFTDAHANFKTCKKIFYNGFERYSGVLVDMYFDHLLAKNFENHTNKSLGLFAENVYEVYTDYEALMPEKSSRFLSYVIKNNIYMTYAEIEGIEQVLKHLSRRLNHNVALNDSLNLFSAAEEKLQNNFDVFFEALKGEFL